MLKPWEIQDKFEFQTLLINRSYVMQLTACVGVLKCVPSHTVQSAKLHALVMLSLLSNALALAACVRT